MSNPSRLNPRTLGRRKLSRRAALAGSMAASVGLLAGGGHLAQAAGEISIALDWFPNANHSGIYWALSEGFFAGAGLDVTVRTPADPSAVLQTVAAGRDTFGISYQPDVLLALSQQVPIVAVVSIVPRPLLGVMSLESTGIASPADLAGKTVGYPGIPAQEAFLRTMLAGEGLAMTDIELVNVEFNLLPALLSDQAQAVMGAYWTHESIVAERQGCPVSMMHVEDWGVPLYDELVLVTSEEFVANSPAIVDGVRGALRQGYDAAAKDQPRALEILLAASAEIDPEVEQEGLALLADIWIKAGPNLGHLDSSRWSAFADWMLDQQLLTEPLELQSAIYPPATTQADATPTP